MGCTIAYPKHPSAVAPLAVEDDAIMRRNISKRIRLHCQRCTNSKLRRGFPRFDDVEYDVEDAMDSAKFSEDATSLVELFVLEVLRSQRNINGFKNIFATASSQQYFLAFVEEELKDNMDLLRDINEYFFDHMNNNGTRSEHLSEFTASKLSAITALSAFSKFLDSTYYSEWRAMEKGSIFELTAAAVTKALSYDNCISENDNEKSDKTYAQRAVNCIESEEFQTLAARSTWLSSLIAAVECLPIGFSIATAESMRHSFPFVYVNKQFEVDTGYAKDEVIGKSGSILHGPATNTVTLNSIRQALSSKNQITANLINYRKDGSKFWNHMSLKPLFDQNNNFLYVVGLSFVMEKSANVDLQMDVISRLIMILPDNVIQHKETEDENNEEFNWPETVSVSRMSAVVQHLKL